MCNEVIAALDPHKARGAIVEIIGDLVFDAVESVQISPVPEATIAVVPGAKPPNVAEVASM